MFWAKRHFAYAEFAPYQVIFEKLLMANPTQYQNFLMFSVQAGGPAKSDYYIGVPNKTFLSLFNGFQEVSEDEVPKEIDTFLVGDQTKEPFTSRFTFKHNRRR
jgi:hypothetical protein